MKINLTTQVDVLPQDKARPPRRWPRRLRSVFLLVCGLVVLLSAFYFLRAPILRSAADLWIINDTPQKADAIVLLGGGLETRPFAAAKLYRDGFAPRILIARARSSPTDEMGLTTREHDVARQVLLKEGVPEAAILEIGQDVRNTYDEAVALRKWFEEEKEKVDAGSQKSEARSPGDFATSSAPYPSPLPNAEREVPTSDLRPPISDPQPSTFNSQPSQTLSAPPSGSQPSTINSQHVRTVLIPTDIFHTRRVRWLFRKQLRHTGVQILVEAVPVREYQQQDWWRHEQGLVAFQNEVLKFAYYWVKY